jgi:hypothetical protein
MDTKKTRLALLAVMTVMFGLAVVDSGNVERYNCWLRYEKVEEKLTKGRKDENTSQNKVSQGPHEV